MAEKKKAGAAKKDAVTEEVATNEEFLTPSNFSFADVLSGKEYPKDTVPVFMNEVAAFDLRLMLDKLDRTPAEDDEARVKIVARIKELEDRLDKTRFVFHLTGISDDLMDDARASADAKFEKLMVQAFSADKQSLIKRLPEAHQMDYLKYLNALVLSLHVEKIDLPNGGTMIAPPPEEIELFLKGAPDSQKDKLQKRIAQLRVDSEAFEHRIDSTFLAKP